MTSQEFASDAFFNRQFTLSPGSVFGNTLKPYQYYLQCPSVTSKRFAIRSEEEQTTYSMQECFPDGTPALEDGTDWYGDDAHMVIGPPCTIDDIAKILQATSIPGVIPTEVIQCSPRGAEAVHITHLSQEAPVPQPPKPIASQSQTQVVHSHKNWLVALIDKLFNIVPSQD